jgi:hypothetical protein
MEDPFLREAWFHLMEEAMHGPGGAREAIRLLADLWKSPEEINRWMERFIPLRSGLSGPEGFRELVEEWWKTIGVVPGSRHLELQEKCEILKARLEEAKATIQQMRTTLAIKGPGREREQSLNKNLNLQTDWTKFWAGSFTKVSGDPAELFEWGQQGQNMMRRWLSTQMQLWEGWFEIMKKLDPSTPGGGWHREAEKVVQLWQEALKKALDAQVEWGHVWSAGQEGKKSKEQSKS